MKRSCWFSMVLTGPLLFSQSDCEAQVREIARPMMPGIARVVKPRGGPPVIYYNPRACRRMGPQACAFFRAHEYAHIRLNHFGRNISVRQAEAEADWMAARMVSPSTAAAARQWFLNGNGGSLQHGRPWQRANRLSASAQLNSPANRQRARNYSRMAAARPQIVYRRIR